jgi:hypothetical protein
MIKAHDLNFDNGEYVFFYIDLFSRYVIQSLKRYFSFFFGVYMTAIVCVGCCSK